MMKKIIILLGLFVALVMTSNAQLYRSIEVDTLDDTETITFDIPGIFDSDGTLQVEVLCTQLTGTSAGSAVLQGSTTGTNWSTINNDQSILECTNDTLTIANGAVGSWSLTKTPYNKYRVSATGSGTHSTKINVYWDK